MAKIFEPLISDKFKVINIRDKKKTYLDFFDVIVTNPPFFLENSVLQSKNKLLRDARYTSLEELNEWFKNMLDYLLRGQSLDLLLVHITSLRCSPGCHSIVFIRVFREFYLILLGWGL